MEDHYYGNDNCNNKNGLKDLVSLKRKLEEVVKTFRCADNVKDNNKDSK